MNPSESFKNSITDVSGVSVGHLTIDAGDVQTGVTVIVPYPFSVRDRKLFIGSFSGGNSASWTGRQVAADFGTFSSPIVLCNSTTLGIAYDALISYGHQLNDDLPIDNAWPPLVIGMDDGYLNDLRQRPVTHDAILDLIKSATDAPMKCGSVGIGRGLCALGGKGGVGDASRVVKLGGEEIVVGVFAVANGGCLPNEKNTNAPRSLEPSTALIVAASAPLLPDGLSALAEACMRSLDELIDWDTEDKQLALAFSTNNSIDHSFEDEFHLKPVRQHLHSQLNEILDAGAEAARAAFLRALTEAEPVTGRKGRRVDRIDVSRLW
jgi:D-aminopeptidase